MESTDEQEANTSEIVPLLKWAGGKRWFAAQHLAFVPENFSRYVEPFLGSGALFFKIRPQTAILSDLNARLIEMYRAITIDWRGVKKHLLEHAKHHSAEYYYKVRSRRCKTEITRAAQMLYLNRTCWNGLYRVNLRGEFNVPRGTKDSVILPTDDFAATAGALKGAELRVADFEDTLADCKAGDFVFIDPPYTVRHNMNGFIKYNDRLFSWEDQVRLKDAAVRANARGADILILNANHESIRELYKGACETTPLDRQSVLAAAAEHRGKVEELAIRLRS
jgi:DNA adenine methylase